jgi:hypothetical protein
LGGYDEIKQKRYQHGAQNVKVVEIPKVPELFPERGALDRVAVDEIAVAPGEELSLDPPLDLQLFNVESNISED